MVLHNNGILEFSAYPIKQTQSVHSRGVTTTLAQSKKNLAKN